MLSHRQRTARLQVLPCSLGRSPGRLAMANPRGCVRRRASLPRHLPAFAGGRRWPPCSRPMSAAAAPHRSWLGAHGARSVRPSARSCSSVISAGSPSCRNLMAPDVVVAALDAWFDRIAGAVHAFGGEVLKFIGDGVLAIFPIGERPPSVVCDAALRAIGAARAGMAHLDEARSRQGLPSLHFGLALHLGEMMWGNVGTADRLDFTAIGPAVNLVSRLEGLCRPLGRTVLVSGTVAAETTTALVPLGDHLLRGIAAPCAVFTLPEE